MVSTDRCGQRASRVFFWKRSVHIHHCYRFGEDSVEKMVVWALDNVPPETSPFILEVGAGNGSLLFALSEAGHDPSKISGVEYGPDAVKLAQAIAHTKANPRADEGEDEDEAVPALKDADKITFGVCDFLKDDVVLLEGMVVEEGSVAVWDLELDKGTFDAIALAEKDESGRTPADGYPARIGRVVKPGGFFLITCECRRVMLRSLYSLDDVAQRATSPKTS